ncbi:F-box/kelch-repeat protein At3g06240-like [Vicia villosa]|uniref:F-box/kelch-repeat protein At3g06240-like n=1 Tax=Vicia villosa TaxID=3911 RepID=UPI00273C3AFD|nr:F-box/kelch-repeat protein At3g06240-like [Vicia villosa]
MTKFPRKFLFQLWNPATNTLSNKFVQQFHSRLFSTRFAQQSLPRIHGLSFGYDNSTDTYKIVLFESNKLEIFSLFSNVLKIIKLPHMSPLQKWDYDSRCRRRFLSDAVYLNDTINLLVRENAKQIVIISLNLNIDTYTKFLPPQDFVEVIPNLPTIHVLEDSLYFSHHTQKTHFIIWKMKEFGIDKSWTQFLKISYEDLDIHNKYGCSLAPLCLYENCSIALVQGETDGRLQVIVYNWFENRIEKTRMVGRMNWMFNQNYVESLVPTS